MIPLLLGAGLLVLLLIAADAFSRAKVESIKRLLAWVAALGGISLAGLLLVTGRAGGAIAAVLFAAPLAYSWWQESLQRRRPKGAPPPGGRTGGFRGGSWGSTQGSPPGGNMSRAEALSVLGLQEGATEDEIREAYKRLMLAVHPDHGGSAWLAARLNQARSVLLRK
jgi:DnaJ homolog subfamily C member 19